MRLVTRLAVSAAATAIVACASMGSPPGGPERLVPPELLGVTPESGATNVRARGVMFEFDVVVNDRNVDDYFLLSPREGEPRVIWRRDRVEVRPRRGFRANTAYSVTLLPGVSDLRGNVMKSGGSVVFSTGPTLPAFMVAGRVFDWMGDRVAPNALVEVIRRPDSLTFVGAADSSGQFAVGPLDAGSYTVRAMMDNNHNHAVDPGEPWDSLSIVVREASPFLELLLAPRDTIGPRLLTVQARDSVTLNVSFDRVLNPGVPLTAASVRVVRGDSTPLRVVAVMSRARFDSVQQAVRDSAARRDTTARRDSVRPPPTAAPPRVAPPDIPAGPPPVLEPRASRPAPIKDFVVLLDSLTPVRPLMTYRVEVASARGLLGAGRASDRVITIPQARHDSVPPARRDSTPPAGARPP